MSSHSDVDENIVEADNVKLEPIATGSKVTLRRKRVRPERKSHSEESNIESNSESEENLNLSRVFHLNVTLEVLHDNVPINEIKQQIALENPVQNLERLINTIEENINNLEQNNTPSEQDAIDWQVQPDMAQAMPIREITKLIPEYNGEEKGLDIFVKKVNKLWLHIAGYEDGDKSQFLLVLQLKLTDKAAEAVQNNEFLDWENVREELVELITPHRNTEKSELKLSSIRQKNNEDIESYAKRIQEALDTLNRSFPENEQNEIIKRENNRKARKSFENGLYDANLRSKAIAKGSVDLKEAIDYIIEQELRFSELKPVNLFCTYCKRNNHTVDQCRQKNSNQKSQSRPNQNQANKKEITCFKCLKKGHYANNCRGQKAIPNTAGENSQEPQQNQNKTFTVREEIPTDKTETVKQSEQTPVSASVSKMIRIEDLGSKN